MYSRTCLCKCLLKKQSRACRTGSSDAKAEQSASDNISLLRLGIPVYTCAKHLAERAQLFTLFMIVLHGKTMQHPLFVMYGPALAMCLYAGIAYCGLCDFKPCNFLGGCRTTGAFEIQIEVGKMRLDRSQAGI